MEHFHQRAAGGETDVAGGTPILARRGGINVVDGVITVDVQSFGLQAAVDMLPQDAHDHRQIDRVGHFTAEVADALFVGLHAAEENGIDERLQAVPQRVKRKRQGQDDQLR